MANDPTINTRPLEDAFERMARSIKNQEQASYKLSIAMDKLGETGIKDLTEKVKQAAKQSNIFTDAQLKLIKTTQDLEDGIKQQEKDLDKRLDSEKELRESIKQSIKYLRENINLSKVEKEAINGYIRGKLDERKQIKQEIKDRKDNMEAFKANTAALIENATSIKSWDYYLNKSTDSIKGWAASNLTARKSMEMLKTAGVQLIDEFNKVTAVGLQGSFVAISYEAVKLKLTFEEFSGIIAKNYDVINQLGGGQTGIEKFSIQLKDASKNLSFMGRDGTLATARFYETLKTFGDTAGSKNFNKAMKTTQNEFVKFQGRYHDTAESFADLMESQVTGENIQHRLNGLNDTARAQLKSEIYLRTENLKNMGLSNEQIKTFNSGLSDIANPQGRKESQVAGETALSMTYLKQLSNQAGTEASKAALPFFEKYYNMQARGADETTLNNELATEEGKKALKAINEAQSVLDQQRAAIVKAGGVATTQQTTLGALRPSGGASLEHVLKNAEIVGTAKREGREQTADVLAKADIASKAAQTKAVDKTTEAMEALRDASQWASAIMKNSLVAGLLAGVTAIATFGIGIWKVTTAIKLLTTASERAAAAVGLGNIPVPGGGPTGGGKGGKWKGAGKIALATAAMGGTAYALNSGKSAEGKSTGDIWSDILSQAAMGATMGEIGGAGLGLVSTGGLASLPLAAIGGIGGGLAGAGKGIYDTWGDWGNSSKINPTPTNTDKADEAAAEAAAAAYQSQSTSPTEKSNNIIEELKKHTNILEQISRNTVAFKGGNPDMYKSLPTRVAANLRNP